MKVLIVWAHPEPASFNGHLVATARDVLTQQGHVVRVTDLYRDGFEPIASERDFVSLSDPDRLVYDAEQLAATAGDGFAGQIQAALDDLVWCDLLILQFPLWWFSTPAIMKGWIDRVMVKGVAYGGGRWYDRGGLTGRRALLSLTTAAYPGMCSPQGINGSIDTILWPLQQGVLRFVGFEALRPHVIWSAGYLDDPGRAQAIAAFRDRLSGIADETPEPAHGRGDFDKGWRMRPEVTPQTVGQWREPSTDAPEA